MVGAAVQSMSLWPRLRRNGKESGRRRKRKENPYASTGLETFALVVTELQAKRVAGGAVDHNKTTMSLSASSVPSLSKSANSYALSRTGSSKGSRSGELANARAEDSAVNAGAEEVEKPGRESGIQQQENCSTELSTSNVAEDTNEEGEVMDIDVAKGCRGGNPRQEFDCAQEQAAATGSCVHREAEGGIFEPKVSYRNRAEIAELPLKVTAASKKRRGSLACVRGKAASKAAHALLVAVLTFLASNRPEFGKGIAAAMTFSIVIRRWRNGKLYARFIFSAMASYFLGHLHSSYLFFLSPKRLTFSSPSLRKVQDEPKIIESAATTTTIEHEQQGSSFANFPLLPSSSSPPSPIPLPGTEIKCPSTHPVSPKTSQGSDHANPSTNHGRKLPWRLKSRLMKSFHLSKLGAAPDGNNPLNSATISTTPSSGDDIRVAPRSDLPLSPTSKTENSDSDSVSSAASPQRDAAASRPKKGKRFSVSRKPKASSEFPKVAESSRQGDGGGARENHRHRSSKRSSASNRVSKDAPTNGVQCFTTMACVSSSSSGLRNIKTGFLPTVEERREMFKVHSPPSAPSSMVTWGGREMSWPLCGLLVALLFLLAGRVPAILATSIFFLVLSQIQKRRSSRGQGRDQKDVMRRALEEVSRKLHIPSIPGSPVQSLTRAADIQSMEYRKGIIIEGLLERNRRGGGS